MLRKPALALAFLLTFGAAVAGASEPGRRRPVTNPMATVDGVIAAVTAEGFRVQTPSGQIDVTLTSSTQFAREAATPQPGDYTIIEGLVARDRRVTASRVSLFTVPSSVAAAETVRVEGRVVSVSVEKSELVLETPGGTVITVSTNETTLIRSDGTVIGLKDVVAGSIARIIGKPTGERTLLALQIDIRTTDAPPHRDLVVGTVAEVRAADQTLLVNPRRDGPGPAVLETVRADANTAIYRRGERIRFSDIALGDFVVAHGSFDASRVLLAARIDVVEPPADAPRIAGRVIETSAAERTLTVAVERGWMGGTPDGPVTVVVTDATTIYRAREQVRFDAIGKGDFVVVAGEWRDGKALVASVIHVATLPDLPPMPSIVGEIVSIENATRTLVVRVRAMRPLETMHDGTVKVLAGDETKIFRNGQPIRFGDLAVGNAVIVAGALRDDKAILATRIDAIVPPERPSHVVGYVSRVGANAIDIIVPTAIPTFAPVRVTLLVDAATEIFRRGERIRLAELKVNEMIVASGEWKGDDTMLARRIEVRDIAPPPGGSSLRGTIAAIEGSTLRLAAADGRWTVTAMRMTLVVRPGGVPSTFSSLRVGEAVDVVGMPTGDHGVMALKIEVLP